MDHFPTWKEAHTAAQRRANETGLDVAIRKASKYDRPGFVVSFASRNDSDYANAEIVRPDRPGGSLKRGIGAKSARIQIVIARVQMTALKETGRMVERDRNYFPEMVAAPEAKAAMWLNRGTDEDVAKARAAMAPEGYDVYTFPTSERDPIGKAKAAAMRTSGLSGSANAGASGRWLFHVNTHTYVDRSDPARSREVVVEAPTAEEALGKLYAWREGSGELGPMIGKSAYKYVGMIDDQSEPTTKRPTIIGGNWKTEGMSGAQVPPITIPLRGWNVLAHDHQGMLMAVKYGNRTQAKAKADQLGAPWQVIASISPARGFKVGYKAQAGLSESTRRVNYYQDRDGIVRHWSSGKQAELPSGDTLVAVYSGHPEGNYVFRTRIDPNTGERVWETAGPAKDYGLSGRGRRSRGMGSVGAEGYKSLTSLPADLRQAVGDAMRSEGKDASRYVWRHDGNGNVDCKEKP